MGVVRRSISKLLATVLEKIGVSGVAFTCPLPADTGVPAAAMDTFDEERWINLKTDTDSKGKRFSEKGEKG
eukprot:10313379-Lingulodinium_polyedra.AAC.1